MKLSTILNDSNVMSIFYTLVFNIICAVLYFIVFLLMKKYCGKTAQEKRGISERNFSIFDFKEDANLQQIVADIFVEKSILQRQIEEEIMARRCSSNVFERFQMELNANWTKGYTQHDLDTSNLQTEVVEENHHKSTSIHKILKEGSSAEPLLIEEESEDTISRKSTLIIDRAHTLNHSIRVEFNHPTTAQTTRGDLYSTLPDSNIRQMEPEMLDKINRKL